MAFNKFKLGSALGTPGSKNYASENKGILSKIILVEKGAEIATEAAAILKVTYDTGIKQDANRWFPTPAITEVEDQTTDPTVQEFPNGDKRTVSLSDYSVSCMVDIPDTVLAQFFKLNDGSWDAYLVWKNGMIEGRCDAAGIKFLPKRVKEFTVNKRTIPNGTEVQRVLFTVTFDVKADFEEFTAHVEPTDFDPNDLDSVRGVDLTMVDATGDAGTVTVQDGTGNGVTGLVLADFDDAGSANNLTGIVEVGGGVYTAAFDGPGAAVINLVASSAISIDDYIQSTGTATATITT